MLVDGTADPEVVAADLLAQAEHDVSAVPILVSLDERIVARVEEEIHRQLETLPTASVARAAVNKNGFAVVVDNIDDAVFACNQLAPEHLEVHTAHPESISGKTLSLTHSHNLTPPLPQHRQVAQLWGSIYWTPRRRGLGRLWRWTQPHSPYRRHSAVLRRVVCVVLHASADVA